MNIATRIHANAIAVALLMQGLAACAAAPATRPGIACEQLLDKSVPASAISLPTRGAVVKSAVEVPANAATGLPVYCKLLGSIAAVDPAAPAIEFELDLPMQWNSKLLMMGGGGFNGAIPITAGNVPAGPYDRPVPLARGYAVVGSDSGHQVRATPQAPLKPGTDAAFALNDEALRNYTGDALKKTHDAALHLIALRYGVKGVDKAYFVGGSTGGREALEVVQRWPQDWDGVISWYPAWNHVALALQAGRVAQALAAPGAWLNQPKRRALFDAALAVCDELDGVVDGIVSHIAACNAAFDPATAKLNGAPLRCADGAELGDTCLSDAQLTALQVFSTAIEFRPALASGETHYPGYNLYGSDLGMVHASPWQSIVTGLALGFVPPAKPLEPGRSPVMNVFWDQWARYLFARNENTDVSTVDPVTRGELRAGVDQLSRVLDVNRTDYSAFANKGGKVLIAHGVGDVLVSTRSTEEYYKRIQATMGEKQVRGFLRFYEVPGYGHALSTVFNAAWDSLTALEDWVEKGVAPGPQVVSDSIGVPGRSRPLCEFPAWPKYRGAGDVNKAASFACVTGDGKARAGS
jgi:pimeloyl-ACP methyl ester carboxylesterase